MRTLQASLHDQVERAPSRRALAFVDPDGRFSWHSLGELYERAAGHSAALVERRLRPGDVCILALPSSESCASLLIATLLLGAVPLLITPPVLPARASFLTAVIRLLVRRTGARLVIVPGTMAWLAEELAPGPGQPRFVAPDTDLPPLTGTRIPRIAPADGSMAALQLTSGTTGVPRICVWTHTAVAAALRGMALAMGLAEDDVCLTWAPLDHDMALANFLLCLTSGIPLALVSPTDFVRKPALWLRGLSSTGATVTWSPNFGFALAARKVRDEEVDGVRLDRVRAFWNAAERIHLDTFRTFHDRFEALGVRLDALKTHYGCAENVGGATFSDLARGFTVEWVDEQLLRDRGVARPLPDSAGDRASVSVVGVGRPYPGLRVRILSRAGRPLQDGRVGEVALETPSPMQEYLGHARDTRRMLRDGLLRTGDLGYVRGGELFWVGRLRERIVVSGRKLDPSDFERVLLRVPGLRRGGFVAFGVDDPEHGTHRVVVAVEVRDPTLDPDLLSAAVRGEVHAQLGVTVDDLLLLQPGTLAEAASRKRRRRVFHRLYLSGHLQASTFTG